MLASNIVYTKYEMTYQVRNHLLCCYVRPDSLKINFHLTLHDVACILNMIHFLFLVSFLTGYSNLTQFSNRLTKKRGDNLNTAAMRHWLW